jgi:hypothetical protein
MGMITRREEEAKAAPAPTASEPKKLYTDDTTKTTPVLDLRTRQIQRQGLYQAAASNPALIGYAADIDALKTVIRELAEDGLKFVNEQ